MFYGGFSPDPESLGQVIFINLENPTGQITVEEVIEEAHNYDAIEQAGGGEAYLIVVKDPHEPIEIVQRLNRTQLTELITRLNERINFDMSIENVA